MDAELARSLVAAFVVPARQERLRSLLLTGKSQRKFREELAHALTLDPRWVVEIPGPQQTPAGIERLLAAHGAPPRCEVISEREEWDGAQLDLPAVLECVVGWGVGTLVSCVRGELAFYEGEEQGDRCLLHRVRRSS